MKPDNRGTFGMLYGGPGIHSIKGGPPLTRDTREHAMKSFRAKYAELKARYLKQKETK